MPARADLYGDAVLVVRDRAANALGLSGGQGSFKLAGILLLIERAKTQSELALLIRLLLSLTHGHPEVSICTEYIIHQLLH
jgi:hypothetical protein